MTKNANPERQPIPPDNATVEALIATMTTAMERYSARTNVTASDVFSALFTMLSRSIQYHLYHSDPPMTLVEQFTMRKTIIKGLERIWNMTAGGGPSSRFRAH